MRGGPACTCVNVQQTVYTLTEELMHEMLLAVLFSLVATGDLNQVWSEIIADSVPTDIQSSFSALVCKLCNLSVFGANL